MKVALCNRIFQHLLKLPCSSYSAMALHQRLHSSGLFGSMPLCATPPRVLPLSLTPNRTAMHSAAAAATSPLVANPAAHQPRRQRPILLAVQAPVNDNLTEVSSPVNTSSARRRSPKSSSAPPPSSAPSSLRQVPGVGPKNEDLLRAKGLGTVEQLRAVHDRHGAEESRTRAFLQDEVGIRNKGHLNSIIDYLCSSGDEQTSRALVEGARGGQQGQGQQQQQQQGQAGSFGLQPKVTLSVEGNISAGKSTFLQILKESGIEDELKVVPEPVDKWQSVGGGKVNLLMEFYQDPQRFAYTFQNYVFLTRMVQERESYSSSMCRLLERSVFSDRMVFVRAVHNSKFMTDTELAIYDSWFSPILSTLPTLVPNGFIYLRADPKTCYRRMQKRSRNEESQVQLEYLEDLHQHHEDWLWAGGVKAADSKCLYLTNSDPTLNTRPSGQPGAGGASAQPQLQALQPLAPPSLSYAVPPVPEALRDSLFILDAKRGPHMLPQLDQVPALVLNCNEDVDVERDEDYRKNIADQVRLYTAYVRDFMRAKATAQSKLLDQHFNGYFLRDSCGNFVYTAPEWHCLSHMDQRDLMDRSQAAEQAAMSSMQTLQDSYRIMRPGGTAQCRTTV